jgi:hypothetical protein
VNRARVLVNTSGNGRDGGEQATTERLASTTFLRA